MEIMNGALLTDCITVPPSDGSLQSEACPLAHTASTYNQSMNVMVVKIGLWYVSTSTSIDTSHLEFLQEQAFCSQSQ